LRSSGLLAKKTTDAWNVLEFLYKLWRDYPEETRSSDEIAIALGWGSKNIDADSKVRGLVAKIRNNHPGYVNKNRDLVEFHLPELGRRYQLEVRPAAPKPEPNVPVVFEHRGKNAERLKSFFCEPSEDLLFVTISPDKILEPISLWFDQRLIRVRQIRVLIWRPSSPDVAAALALHLGQLPTHFEKNLREAWESWNILAREQNAMSVARGEKSVLEIQGYRSTPTMLGILNSKLIQVELLPFSDPQGKEQGTHAKRPALLLNPTDTPISFEIFTNAFNDLWQHAVRSSKSQA
jgi:hypothetical protein